MQREIVCTDGTRIVPVSRWITLHFENVTNRSRVWIFSDDNGDVITFSWKGKKYALSQFWRLGTSQCTIEPLIYEDRNGRQGVIGGLDAYDYLPMFLEVDDRREQVRLYRRIGD